ncbi:F-box protein At3g12350 [Rutidosis leptorrhynchoides]|uniref:F-box protein At3g12350 n=1 Tax=Rutidosis leptorrhynchoides TaxID=125765 RepID=UPI003A9941EC
MSNLTAVDTPMSPELLQFSDFPEDVQLCILSFLTPSEISSFACTSKRNLSLCRTDSKLWFSMCDRRWGSKTHIKKWGSGKIAYRHLYKTLHEYENLIGFWRLSSRNQTQSQIRTTPNLISSKPPALVYFEWGSCFITGSRVSPSNNGNYDVIKSPFLLMGISPKGEIVNYLEPYCGFQLDSSLISIVENGLVSSLEGIDLVNVNVNHIGEYHIVIEERVGFGLSGNLNVANEEIGFESGSPPTEVYQYFANRTSPVGRQRRREKERNWNKKWESEHFVKIVNYCPTDLRPLQGLWKGICEDANLDFYLVVYDDIGGIACRRIGDSCKPFSSYAPVFWTSNTTFFESPFSSEEKDIYDTREHLLPPGQLLRSEMEPVSRICYINSSYDLVLPGLVGPTTVNPHNCEGRIWQYGDGTFGFGFLRDNHIIDLKHIVVDGCLLDAMQPL